MLVAHAWKENELEVFAGIAVVVEYLHQTVLNDVCHTFFFKIVRLYTLIVSEMRKCYMVKGGKKRFCE